jgi:hypothetical protein
LEKRYCKFDKKNAETITKNGYFAENLFTLSLFGAINETSINKNPKSDKVSLIVFEVMSHEEEKKDVFDDTNTIAMLLVYADKELSDNLSKADKQRTEGF